MENMMKQYAKQAKERLRNGFWNEVNAKRREDMLDALRQGKSAEVVAQTYTERLRQTIFFKMKDEDVEFYKKVKEIVDSGVTVTNPIGLLADQKLLESLPSDQKQKYVLSVVEKYNSMREAYIQEKKAGLNF